MTTRLFKILFICFGWILYGQVQKELTLTAPVAQGSPTNDQVARDRVNMTGNFRTQGSTGRFYAGTNPHMVLSTEYTSNFNVDQTPNNFIDYSLPVGSVSGAVDVNTLTGAAQYSVPIKLPAGTAGMMPSVSINYNNQSGNDILGIGWSLAASSCILRTGKTVDLDGAESTFLTGTDDRFLLDGERLVLISGNHEAVGAQYATVLESYSRISIELGTDGAKYFKVIYKDGKIAEYGSSLNSRKSFETCGVAMDFGYYLTKVIDANGNYMIFTYDKEHNSVLKSIEYTGNAAAGINPYAKVSFYYNNQRSDVVVSRYYGARQVEDQLLYKIVSTLNGAAFSSYELSYNNSDVSRLAKITEFGIDGMRYNPTYFTWGDKGDGYLEQKAKHSMVPQLRYNIADFDGDGRSDYLYYEQKSTYTTADQVKVEGGFLTSGFPLEPGFVKMHTLDIDGDGKDEVLLQKLSGSIQTFICYGYSSMPTSAPLRFYRRSQDDFVVNSTDPELSFLSSDFTGDGKPDHILLNNVKQIFKTINFTTITTSLSGLRLFIGRHNQNSKIDIYSSNSTDDYISVFEYDEATTALIKTNHRLNYSSYSKNIDVLQIGDFNGDGFSDVYYYIPNERVFRVNYNVIDECRASKVSYVTQESGTGMSIGYFVGNYPSFEFNSFRHDLMGDFNGDGFMDIAHSYVLSNYGPVLATSNNPTPQVPDGLKIIVGYGKKWGGFTMKEYYYSGAQVSNINASYKSNMFVGDFDGDRRADLFINTLDKATNAFSSTCNLNGNTPTCLMGGSNAGFPLNFLIKFEAANYSENLITDITNGIGGRTRILYTLGIGNVIGDMGWYDVNKTEIKVPSPVFCNKIYDYIGNERFETSYNFEGGFLYSTKYKKPLGFSNISITYDAVAHIPYRKIRRSLFGDAQYLMDVRDDKGPDYTTADYTYIINNVTKQRKILKTQERTVVLYDNIDNLLNHQYDVYGNLIKTNVLFKDGSTASTEYSNFIQAASWCPYLAQDLTSTKQSFGKPSYVRKAKSIYDIKGNLLSSIEDPDLQSANDPDGCKELVTSYTDFTATGLPRTITVSSSFSGFMVRTTKTQYDDLHRLVLQKTNQLNQNTVYEYDYRGNLTKSTGIDGLSTRFSYDGLGRLTESINPQGNKTTIVLGWDLRTDINSVYYKSTKAQGGPEEKSWFNAVGKEVLQQTEVYNGKVYVAKKHYYGGLPQSVSDPYFEGASNTLVTNYDYAEYPNRYVNITKGSLVTESNYGPGSITTTNPAGQKSVTLKNALGLTASVEDNLGKKILYDYLSNGQINTVTTGGGTISYEYDKLGRKKTMIDPNTGLTRYTYDPLGNVLTEKDARGITYTMTYDILGRILTKSTPGNSTIPSDLTTYVYNTTGNGINQVATITNVLNGQASLLSHTYDRFGRLTSTSETINGAAFKTDYEYDNLGNLIKTIYPSGFAVKYVYSDIGVLRQLNRADNNDVIWSIASENASGQMTGSYYGNGMSENLSYDAYGYPTSIVHNVSYQGAHWAMHYSFDPTTGNLNWRKDHLRNLTENFTYDGLNRLKDISKNNISLLSLQYEDNGNILSKSDIGLYKYDPFHINAVNKVQNDAALISSLTQNISYTAFDSPFELTQGVHKMSYGYGVDQARNIAKYYQNNVLNTTTYYTGSYEKEISASGAIKETHYISGGAGLSALYIIQNGTGTMYYVGKDHLGSIMKLYDQNRNPVTEYSYDAWGRRRNPADWTYTGFTASTITARGYTGHEHMDVFGLINMNARLYDPLLGRMLSPDNYIQNGAFSQNYNRYSYAYNNPLSYTDPDGNFIVPILFGAIYGAAIGSFGSSAVYSVVSLSNGTFTWNGLGNAAKYGAVSGAVGGAIGGIALNSQFGQSLGMNVMKNAASDIGTNLALGNNVSYNTIGSSIFSSAATSGIPDYTGVNGGRFVNIMAELAYSSSVGVLRGGIGGYTNSIVNGSDMNSGVLNGALTGGLGGFVNSGLLISMFGSTIKPNNIFSKNPKASQLSVTNYINSKINSKYNLSRTYGPVFRRGGLYKIFTGRGVTWGRNIVVPGNDFETYIHEYYHYVQQVGQGFGLMQSRGIYEQLRASFTNYRYDPYLTNGTNEYDADFGTVPIQYNFK